MYTAVSYTSTLGHALYSYFPYINDIITLHAENSNKAISKRTLPGFVITAIVTIPIK